MILPNYLFQRIIDYIITYIYKIKPKNLQITNNTNIKYCHNETICLSLVNKLTFEWVSIYLSVVLNFKNYNLLKPLIGNNSFKLIKEKNKIVKIYKSLSEYKKCNNKNSFKKVLIKCNNEEANQLLFKSTEEYPSNTLFDLKFLFYLGGPFYWEEIDEAKLSDINKRLKINAITILGQQSNRTPETLEKIKKINPKKIKFTSRHYQSLVCAHPDISTLFQSPTLKSLKYKSDYVDPCKLTKIDNENTNLKSLSVEFDIIHLVQQFNKKNHQLKQEWDSMTHHLSNNKTLKSFLLSTYFSWVGGFSFDDLEGKGKLNFSLLLKGIKTILTSPSTRIETLKICFFNNFVEDPAFTESLVENKTIKNLYIRATSLDSIFENVLPYNNTIRNIVIANCDITEKILKTITTINVYSITFISSRDKTNKILNLFSKNLIFNHIKEINFVTNIDSQDEKFNFKPVNVLVNYYYKKETLNKKL
ncbi:hypothetical protein DICPUDRAFT_81942 [Dictyostelium purpureum]|uniref:Uncharacterized protein n=1 Tax=Dictyostelium purpureum TaxID=5786 RepID=F0ZV20_DICPU|nr:uncharacterized protein DICPUDRAFT_81942 [Dictyostelium purpureum]EGC32219.1 hypothetical protein DICPUDRAFT_81942 [Dictyostelium purpureum]|eukprot:XP_003291255.1 hypothetical protein DICPUDRAFT_81942 [Dictyostelium purpureum]